MPLITGSTTPKAAATTTAASNTLPPPSRIFRPDRVASELAELTMPEAPTAGVVCVFTLASGLEPAAGVEVAGSGVSSAARLSSTAVFIIIDPVDSGGVNGLLLVHVL